MNKTAVVEVTPAADQPLAKGQYSPATKSDLRCPCPMVNALANHGFINRDGRNIRSDDLKDALLQHTGISTSMALPFARVPYNEFQTPEMKAARKPLSIVDKAWCVLTDPFSLPALADKGGVRRPGQEDAAGYKVIDLDQLSLPHLIEHDISLTRLDYNQGDNHTRDPDSVDALLASSSDGGKTLSVQDLAQYRKRRIAKQMEESPEVKYGAYEHTMACGEISLIMGVFGEKDRVPCSYARAFLKEERLPIQEGWSKRQWWPLGLVELNIMVYKVKQMIGLKY